MVDTIVKINADTLRISSVIERIVSKEMLLENKSCIEADLARTKAMLDDVNAKLAMLVKS